MNKTMLLIITRVLGMSLIMVEINNEIDGDTPQFTQYPF